MYRRKDFQNEFRLQIFDMNIVKVLLHRFLIGAPFLFSQPAPSLSRGGGGYL